MLRKDDYRNIALSITNGKIPLKKAKKIFHNLCSFKGNDGKDCGLFETGFVAFQEDKPDLDSYSTLFMKLSFIKERWKNNRKLWDNITFTNIYGGWKVTNVPKYLGKCAKSDFVPTPLM